MRKRFSFGGGDVIQGWGGELHRSRARPGARAGSLPCPSYLSSGLQRFEAQEELLPGAAEVSPASSIGHQS